MANLLDKSRASREAEDLEGKDRNHTGEKLSCAVSGDLSKHLTIPSDPPQFATFHQLIGFYRSKSPGRVKSVRLSKESRSSTTDTPIAWLFVAARVHRALDICDQATRQAFELRWSKDWPDKWDVEMIVADIGRQLGCSARTAFRYLKNARQQVERSARQANLLPPEDEGR